MTRFLEWALDLEHISFGADAPLVVEFSRAWPGWLLVGCLLIGALWVFTVYRQELGSRFRRCLVGSLRLCQLLLLFVLLMGPALVLQQNRVERSVVGILVDASASMGFVDRHDPAAGAGSRLDMVRGSLLRDDGALLAEVTKTHDVLGWTFSGGLEQGVAAENASEVSQLVELFESATADGLRTDVGGAISQLIAKSGGRRFAGIVVVTDGRSTDGSELSAGLDAATLGQIPVHCVRVGSIAPPPDVVVRGLRAPHQVLARDLLTVEADVEFGGIEEGLSVEVRLVDEMTGGVVARESVLAGAEPVSVELHTKPERIGSHRFRLEADALVGELSYENNSDRVEVDVIDDHLRVLYVDGYPRYEYRYLKNALIREDSLDVSVLLLEADEDFVQEGTLPIRRFPQSPEELNRFDVIILGDVDPRGGWLAAAQMNMLLDAVANNGQGLAVIAGERAAPARFAGTPLSRLLPVRLDPSGGRREAGVEGFRPMITPEGFASSILRFDTDREQNGALFAGLPELYWAMPTLGAKPGATVLMEHPTRKNSGDGGKLPLLVTGRYGRGKVLFQATDDTWRWRRHTGELLHDAYWVQLVRFVANPGRNRPETPFEIRSDARSFAYGDPVHVRVEIFDPQILGEIEEGVILELARLVAPVSGGDTGEGSAGGRGGELRADVLMKVPAVRIGVEASVFEATIVPESSGNFRVSAPELSAGLSGLDKRVGPLLFDVKGADLEAKQPQADYDALERIAASTGGEVVGASGLAAILAGVPDRSIRIPDDIVEPLWDTKLALMLFVVLISTEWGLRKAFGMV